MTPLGGAAPSPSPPLTPTPGRSHPGPRPEGEKPGCSGSDRGAKANRSSRSGNSVWQHVTVTTPVCPWEGNTAKGERPGRGAILHLDTKSGRPVPGAIRGQVPRVRRGSALTRKESLRKGQLIWKRPILTDVARVSVQLEGDSRAPDDSAQGCEESGRSFQGGGKTPVQEGEDGPRGAA